MGLYISSLHEIASAIARISRVFVIINTPIKTARSPSKRGKSISGILSSFGFHPSQPQLIVQITTIPQMFQD